MTAPHANQIIGDYTSRLEAALAPVAPERRRELVEGAAALVPVAGRTLLEGRPIDLTDVQSRRVPIPGLRFHVGRALS